MECPAQIAIGASPCMRMLSHGHFMLPLFLCLQINYETKVVSCHTASLDKYQEFRKAAYF